MRSCIRLIWNLPVRGSPRTPLLPFLLEVIPGDIFGLGMTLAEIPGEKEDAYAQGNHEDNGRCTLERSSQHTELWCLEAGRSEVAGAYNDEDDVLVRTIRTFLRNVHGS